MERDLMHELADEIERNGSPQEREQMKVLLGSMALVEMEDNPCIIRGEE